jgi:hypothetical protein
VLETFHGRAVQFDCHSSGGGGTRGEGMIKSSRKRIWKGNVVCVREKINSHGVLVGKYEDKRPLGRFRGRLEYNIEVDPKDVGWDSMDEFDPTENTNSWLALVQTLINFRYYKMRVIFG